MFFRQLQFHRLLPCLLLILLAFFTRFFRLDWGSGFFFHPDENNMAVALSQLTFDNLDPHFYAYGQFPLYLAFYSYQLLSILLRQYWSAPIPFSEAVLTLRVWSAIFSLTSVWLVYQIGLKLFTSRSLAVLLTVLVIFLPSLIQLSHFGTTESLLIFVFLANIYLSYRFLDTKKPVNLTILGLITGIGLASKLTALFFILPALIAIFILLVSGKLSLKLAFISTIYYLTVSVALGILLSPYNLLNFPDFLSSMQYETSVARGTLQVFYTRQFLTATPYLFQFQKVFPYAVGLTGFIIGLAGLLVFILSLPRLKGPSRYYWLILLVPAVVYFVYNGQLFVMWTRFVSPVFPLFPFFSVYLFTRIRSKPLVYFLTVISILPGLVFLNLYFQLDVRIQANNWINRQIPPGSTILSEAGNVLNLPLTGNYQVTNFDFYGLDANPDLISKLPQEIASSDYIIVPSRRIFKNQKSPGFPVSQSYYDSLFSGGLGYDSVATLTPSSYFLLDYENAEETWTVFDQPVVRIFKNTKKLSSDRVADILK